MSESQNSAQTNVGG